MLGGIIRRSVPKPLWCQDQVYVDITGWFVSKFLFTKNFILLWGKIS